MAQEYSEYLAINVLNEQQLVSYRLLSRALKIHVNLAKQMLYDFHRKQNAKKPGSVHATYLVTGTRKPQTAKQTNGVHSQSQDGDDTVMRSSPPMPSSSMPRTEEEAVAPVPVRSVLLVKEEHLDKAKATFEHITAIHVYSLQAKGLSDLHALTECNRKIAADYASEDPLVARKQYGTIQNPNVKRRTQKRGPPPPPSVKAPAAKPDAAAPTTTTKPATQGKQASKASNDSQPTSVKATPEPEKSTATAKKGAASKPPTNKRQASDIFKSFAKGANKPKKASGSTESSAAATPAPPEDEEMSGMFDDEEPEDDTTKEEVEVSAGTGRSKKDRQAELEAMMDAEEEEDKDENMEDAEQAADESHEAQKELVDKKAESQAAEEPKETVTVENGRRRGRRRVMKKKTVKDEEGYLVTREEAAWESFSEDEPAPKKPKMAPAAATTKSTAKKGAGKPGQGNIMSFFGKKP